MKQTDGPQQPISDSAESWDQRYSAEQVWSGNANDALIAGSSNLNRAKP